MNGTKNNAKELDEERQIDQVSVMLLEPLRDLYVDSVVNDERLAKTFSVMTSLFLSTWGLVASFLHKG